MNLKQLLLLYAPAIIFPVIFELETFSKVIESDQYWKVFLKERYRKYFYENMPINYYRNKSILISSYYIARWYIK